MLFHFTLKSADFFLFHKCYTVFLLLLPSFSPWYKGFALHLLLGNPWNSRLFSKALKKEDAMHCYCFSSKGDEGWKVKTCFLSCIFSAHTTAHISLFFSHFLLRVKKIVLTPEWKFINSKLKSVLHCLTKTLLPKPSGGEKARWERMLAFSKASSLCGQWTW